MEFKQVFSICLVIILLVNLVLLAFRKISNLYFWLIIAATAIIAFKVIPRIK
ncbi:MAG: hypothetical protein KAK00_10660 [Nanoarchaeota archaeon]|nr:hypothetical protein [Nanoarchaeota archaeon]